MPTTYPSTLPSTFSTLFPTIEKIEITVEETGDFEQKTESTRTVKYGPYSSLHACGNPRCQKGGLHLRPIIDDMVSRGDTKYADSHKCPGKEFIKNREVTICDNHFKVSINLTYKDDDQPAR
jgi:hypothetical protein